MDAGIADRYPTWKLAVPWFLLLIITGVFEGVRTWQMFSFLDEMSSSTGYDGSEYESHIASLVGGMMASMVTLVLSVIYAVVVMDKEPPSN